MKAEIKDRDRKSNLKGVPTSQKHINQNNCNGGDNITTGDKYCTLHTASAMRKLSGMYKLCITKKLGLEEDLLYKHY